MSRFQNRRWLVIPVEKIDDIDFNQVHESSADSLRKSIDNTLTFVKYEVNVVDETYTESKKNEKGDIVRAIKKCIEVLKDSKTERGEKQFHLI